MEKNVRLCDTLTDEGFIAIAKILISDLFSRIDSIVNAMGVDPVRDKADIEEMRGDILSPFWEGISMGHNAEILEYFNSRISERESQLEAVS